MGLSLSSKIIGVCVFQEVLDEAQINYFSIDFKFRRKGYGSFFMNYLISQYEIKNFKKLLLEVSEANLIANKFYTKLEFLTVGRRKNYYKDGSDAVLKEKKLIK